MSAPQIRYQGPKINPKVPWDIRIHLEQLYSKLGNHTQAFAIVNEHVSAITGKTTTILQTVAGGGGGGSVPAVVGIGTVNDQTGQTAYTTSSGDNGALIVLSDASPIALTLAGAALPTSAQATPLLLHPLLPPARP